MASLTRLSLIDQLKSSSDGAAWDQFMSIYGRLVMGWLARQGVQHNDSEDIRQEVMAVVLSEIGQFEHNGRKGAFRCWLRRVTANRMHRLWKQKSQEEKRLCRVDLSSIADGLLDDHANLSIAWDREHDQFVLQELLAKMRDRFESNTLMAFQRTSVLAEPVDQVANDLGMSLGAVRVAQHRVIKALKSVANQLVDLP